MQASKEIGRPIVYEFSREALSEAGATHVVPPFSVVASNTMDLSVGRYTFLLDLASAWEQGLFVWQMHCTIRQRFLASGISA